MRLGNSSDDANLRMSHRAQLGYLAKSAHSHFEHQRLRLVGGIQNRRRQTKIIVERTLIGMSFKNDTQCTSNQIFSRSFTDRTSYPYNALT